MSRIQLTLFSIPKGNFKFKGHFSQILYEPTEVKIHKMESLAAIMYASFPDNLPYEYAMKQGISQHTNSGHLSSGFPRQANRAPGVYLNMVYAGMSDVTSIFMYLHKRAWGYERFTGPMLFFNYYSADSICREMYYGYVLYSWKCRIYNITNWVPEISIP